MITPEISVRRALFAALFWLLVLGEAVTLAQPVEGALAAQQLEAIRALEAAGSTLAVHAIDLQTGEVLLSARAEEARIPASVQKIATVTAAAFEAEGGATIETTLAIKGSIVDGRLIGALVLKGQCDPLLSAERDLPRMVHALEQSGVRQIQGPILVDDLSFEGPRRARGWPEGDPATPWMSGPAALALDGGTVLLRIKRGEEPVVVLSPEGAGVRVKNELRWSSRDRRSVAVRQTEGEFDLIIRGETPRKDGEAHRAALLDPALVFGRALWDALKAAGIEVTEGVRRVGPADASEELRVIWRFRRSLGQLYAPILGASDNHVAEMLFAHLGFRRGGRASFKTGAQAVAAILGERKIPIEGTVIVDGSGLSRENAISARTVTALLKALEDRQMLKALEPDFAQGGEPGTTLRQRLEDLRARLSAKTGTLRDVTALAGVLTNRNGRRIAFALLAQTREGQSDQRSAQRKLQDQLVRAFDAWVKP